MKIILLLVRDVTALGGFVFFGLTLLLMAVLGEWPFFFKLFVGLIIIAAIGIGTRLIYFKERPKKQNHKNAIEKVDASSFPSVHSARATFLALIFGVFFNKTEVTIALMAVGLAVIYSRIYLRKHDWKDALGGAVLGILTFYFIQNILF